MKKKLIDKSYFVFNGCHNCLRVFKKQEWDGCDEYYCHRVKAGRRPLCGSVFMNEYKEIKGQPFFQGVGYTRWLKGAKLRLVSPQGRCKYWKEI